MESPVIRSIGRRRRSDGKDEEDLVVSAVTYLV